jgi:serine/threonine protein kinase
MEAIGKNELTLDPEVEAERKLEATLESPENAFLFAHKQHISRIENAETAVEALRIAEEIIMRRLEATYKFHLLEPVEGVEVESIKLAVIKETLDSIKANQEIIGEGGDAIVVIDKSRISELPPELCYKFAKTEKTPRGRNPMSEEAILQGDFYEIANELSQYHIGVPRPFYMTELGHDKLIAMEKLPARSIEDILHGRGSLPDWFDIDKFCENLKRFLTELHARGLYHRDMHVGNIMVRQSPEEPEDGKWGYVIDFGLSGYGVENLDPYRKEVAGTSFTYADDDGIISEVHHVLHDYRNRQRGT